MLLSLNVWRAAPARPDPPQVRVCAAFSTDVPHKRVHFRATLRPQQEAHGAVPTELPASSAAAASTDLGDDAYVQATQCVAQRANDALAGMTLAHPIQRQHVGDVYVVGSDRSLTIRVDITYLADAQVRSRAPRGLRTTKRLGC